MLTERGALRAIMGGVDSELTLGAAIVAAGGLLAEVFRRWLKSLSGVRLAADKAAAEARIAETRTMDRVNETASRAIDAMIGHSRSEAQVIAAIDALRTALVDAIEARRREDAVLLQAFRDAETRLGDVVERMDNYAEFKKSAVYRPGR